MVCLVAVAGLAEVEGDGEGLALGEGDAAMEGDPESSSILADLAPGGTGFEKDGGWEHVGCDVQKRTGTPADTHMQVAV